MINILLSITAVLVVLALIHTVWVNVRDAGESTDDDGAGTLADMPCARCGKHHDHTACIKIRGFSESYAYCLTCVDELTKKEPEYDEEGEYNESEYDESYGENVRGGGGTTVCTRCGGLVSDEEQSRNIRRGGDQRTSEPWCTQCLDGYPEYDEESEMIQFLPLPPYLTNADGSVYKGDEHPPANEESTYITVCKHCGCGLNLPGDMCLPCFTKDFTEENGGF